jgi:hypothetical protein
MTAHVRQPTRPRALRSRAPRPRSPWSCRQPGPVFGDVHEQFASACSADPPRSYRVYAVRRRHVPTVSRSLSRRSGLVRAAVRGFHGLDVRDALFRLQYLRILLFPPTPALLSENGIRNGAAQVTTSRRPRRSPPAFAVKRAASTMTGTRTRVWPESSICGSVPTRPLTWGHSETPVSVTAGPIAYGRSNTDVWKWPSCREGLPFSR